LRRTKPLLPVLRCLTFVTTLGIMLMKTPARLWAWSRRHCKERQFSASPLLRLDGCTKCLPISCIRADFICAAFGRVAEQTRAMRRSLCISCFGLFNGAGAVSRMVLWRTWKNFCDVTVITVEHSLGSVAQSSSSNSVLGRNQEATCYTILLILHNPPSLASADQASSRKRPSRIPPSCPTIPSILSFHNPPWSWPSTIAIQLFTYSPP